MKGLLFTYAVTFGGSLVALFNPFYGLLAYICLAIIRPSSLWYWSVPPDTNFSRILGIAMLAGWALNGFGNWHFGRAGAIVYALIGYLLWSTLGAVLATNQELAWTFVGELAKIVLPVVVGMTTIDSMHKIRQLTWLIVLSMGYVAYELNVSYYSGFNMLQEIGFGGMDNNSFAIALVTGIGFAFFLGIREPILWRKLVAFGAAALMAHAVFFSFSRGGMLALMITGMATLLLVEKKCLSHYGWFALGLAIALWMAGPQVRERFATAFVDSEQRDASASSRVELWADCWDVMLRYPLFGSGPDHWLLIASEYGWPAGKEAHSLWLQVGAELGFVGLGLLVAYYTLTILGLWPYLSGRLKPRNESVPHLARMVIASLAGFVVAAQFVSLEGLELPYYIALCGAAGLAVESRCVTALQPMARIRKNDGLHLAYRGGNA